jgi:hypothetical protein
VSQPTQEIQETPSCGTCKKPLKPGTACVTFKTHHRKCIERLMSVERSLY